MRLSDLFKKKRDNSENGAKSSLSIQDKLEDNEFIKRGIEALKADVSGMEYFMEFQYQKAKECFDLAIDDGLEKASTYKYRGFCFQKNDSNYEAIDDFTHSILLNSEDWETYYFRSNSFDNLRKYEEKLFDINKIIDILQKKKTLTDEESDILSKCQIDLKYTIELVKNAKELSELQSNWEKSLNKIREDKLKRNTEDDTNSS